VLLFNIQDFYLEELSVGKINVLLESAVQDLRCWLQYAYFSGEAVEKRVMIVCAA